MATSNSAAPIGRVPVSKEIVDHLTCPRELKLLETACILLPCFHRVNQAAAEALDGTSCPISGCGKIINGFTEDVYTRKTVAILMRSPEVIEMVKPVRQQAQPPQELDYPGEQGEFVLEKIEGMDANWKASFNEKSDSHRFLVLRAVDVEKSLIKRVKIRSMVVFSLYIEVKFNVEQRDKLNKYLAAHSLDELPEGRNKLSYGGSGRTKSFFKIFLKNNKVPVECSTLLQRFTEVETWDLVKKYPGARAVFFLSKRLDVCEYKTCDDGLVKSLIIEKGKLTLTYNTLTPARMEYLEYFGFDCSFVIENRQAIEVVIEDSQAIEVVIENRQAIEVMRNILLKNNLFFGKEDDPFAIF